MIPNAISQLQSAVNVMTSPDGQWQFCAYWRLDGQLIVARRNRITEIWGRNHDQVVLSTGTAATELAVPVADDDHNYASIMVDPQGRLRVWANMHNNPLRYVRTTAAHTTDGWLNSTSGWEVATMPDENVNNTYPTPVLLRPGHGANEYAFFYIRGGDATTVSGRADGWNYWMDQAGNWSAKRLMFQGLSIPGAGQNGGTGSTSAADDLTNFSPYPTNFHVEENNRPNPGRMHVSWIWRHTGSGVEPGGEYPDARSNVLAHYGYSDDNGVTWKSIDGVTLPMPITPVNATAARIPGGALITSISRSQDFGGLVLATLDITDHGLANGNTVFIFHDDPLGTQSSFQGQFTIVNNNVGPANIVAWLQAGATEASSHRGTLTRQDYNNWGSICLDNQGMPHMLVSISPTRYIRRNAANTAWTESTINNPFNGTQFTVKPEAFWIKNQLWGLTVSTDPTRRVILMRLTGPNLPEVKTLSHVVGGGWDVSRDQMAYYLLGAAEAIAPDGDKARVASYGGPTRRLRFSIL